MAAPAKIAGVAILLPAREASGQKIFAVRFSVRLPSGSGADKVGFLGSMGGSSPPFPFLFPQISHPRENAGLLCTVIVDFPYPNKGAPSIRAGMNETGRTGAARP